MDLNNLYNFKNPVKNFLNINELEFPNSVANFILWDLCWAEPFNFRVKKHGNKYRTLKMPNILNFNRAYEHFKNLPYFDDIQSMDRSHKRLSADTKTGDFKSGEFEKQLEQDFEKLCVYDNLIKLDIKEYYGRIYTHKLTIPDDHDERFFTCINSGATNGLIMGNYLSLYFAELNLKNISKDIENELSRLKIDCEFSYFSDDFYFFCNKSDNDNIIKVFDYILEKYELERNDEKFEIWNYETFNNYNMVERFWKRIMAYCNEGFVKEEKMKSRMLEEHLPVDDFKHKMYFVNQLIYRISKLNDERQKKVLVNNFFKTNYFRDLDLNNYKVMIYDYHQLCFLFKTFPESMLYSIDKFCEMDDFDKSKVKKFFKIRYIESLKEPFNDEQLYYYYAIKLLGFDDILKNTGVLVSESKNQILISYYLKYNEFEDHIINSLKNNNDELLWFQNYHLILCCPELLSDLENSINKYLIPKSALDKKGDNDTTKTSKQKQRKYYTNFYKKNLESNKSIIKNIEDVTEEIKQYLKIKMHEDEEM